ncbi:MAG: ABC transporter permease subunit [Candidatus Kapaibacteriota bacterium]
METLYKITIFQLQNVIRSTWISIYTLGLILLTTLIIYFTNDSSKIIVSLMTIMFILNPLIGVLFGSIYLYNSREFIELVLTQPITRGTLYFGLFLGLSIPIVFVTLVGVGFPLALSRIIEPELIGNLVATSIFVICIFVSIAFLITTFIDERSTGLGIAFIVWLVLCWVYDGFVLFFSYAFQDYPIEKILLGLTIVNPIDLARINILIKFDAAAMLGITGAVFQEFISATWGKILTFFAHIVWIVLPLAFGYKKFKMKDF